ncbi:phosphoesterase [Bizionia argentinensis JUB59]|uniref:Phosphoesterase n=1 Tax=Bizionia argentinensis JUB59 TaxID=1046627 RepID=G2EAF2_9FLAO|nr:metallophosphoesterase [Bizionia argentinensis]EGV44556.2 phosphoesterase [Bizionia argentinensis JUB59]
MNISYRLVFSFLFLTIFLGCATFKTQYKEPYIPLQETDKSIEYSFYLIGDAGNSPIGTKTDALQAFEDALKLADTNSSAFFLGDNIYPRGLPEKTEKSYAFAKHQLDVQIESVKDFEGKPIFLPGNHDWYSDGLIGLKRQQDYITNALGKNTFLPKKGCPIDNKTITDNIELILVDAKWYMTNWNKHPTINDDCEIKTREAFLEEFESRIKKARGKTTIVAMHHPVFTNGPHGGQYTFMDHMKPLPVLGTLKNILRKTTGISPEDIQNKSYNEFRKRIITLAQENERVIFVSGHDHNLQYLVQDNLVQIISGSGSKSSATRNVGNGLFSSSEPGYARLDVFNDGSSQVRFVAANKDTVLFSKEVYSAKKQEAQMYRENIPQTIKASIYTPEETDKSNFYKFLWGERYSQEFSTPIQVKTVMLDTLFGGLKSVRKGGGTQSNSLRLADSSGREYVMRGLRKNALNYIQAFAFKDQYVEGQFNNTVAEEAVFHVFTGSYPYASFVTATLSDAISVLHTNPVLYYVPHQKNIEPFNDTFGDELYMIEEHAGNDHGNIESFAFSNKLVGTNGMLEEIRKDENTVIDEAAYIRARLFDMLIGDWDRHHDQWRWAKTKKDDKTVYIPVPRDRDQAFSNMNDGLLLNLASKLIPVARLLKGYSDDLKSPKWFNLEPFPLDVSLISQSDKTVWDEQVKHIMNHLTDEIIEEAFLNVPQELQGENAEDIKSKLKSRRSNLQKISDTYFAHINKIAVVKGTDKDDYFDIERLPNGETKVIAYRIKKGKRADVFHHRTYSKNETKEIWIYALDDDDVFHVHGEGNRYITLRLIGGQNNDVYNIENGKKTHFYDYKSKKNTIRTVQGKKHLTNNYDINTYNYLKIKNNANQFIPIIGYNPDDGIKLGLKDTYTVYGFDRNPFTSQHKLSAAYYFATYGFDISYKGEFAHIIGDFNLGLDVVFTSPNYSVNFFGYGNETRNLNRDNYNLYKKDYNRVRLQTFRFAPSLIYKGYLDGIFTLGLAYETIQVEKTQNRFISDYYMSSLSESGNSFVGAYASYHFENRNHAAYPSVGFETNLKLGYRTNLDKSKSIGYIIPDVSFDYNLEPTGKLVLATKLKAHLNLGDNYEFYQAASIGASDGLRGFRNQRFTGRNSFYQLTDLRYMFSKLKTGILPINLGVYTGVDYGRVWLKDDFSEKWHNSYGGGLLLIAAEVFTGNISLFNSDDGFRFAFSLGVDF